MISRRTLAVPTFAALTIAAGLGLSPRLVAQSSATRPDGVSMLYSGMRWRSIGPFRAGRVSGVSGVAGNPAVYYIGTPGGGVWKTTDGGMKWAPISDAVPVASIGAVAVAPSNPNVVYFGTGDVSEVGGAVNAGDGVYKSTDAGATWTHVGLDQTWHTGALWIDPRDPDTVVVAALGHTWAKDTERGVFKTTDGGRSWKKTLYVDEETGAVDVAFDTANPRIGFATVWGHYVAPGNTLGVLNGTGHGAIYKTTDEGDTWTRIDGHGLPTERVGRIGVAVARGGQRVFAIVSAQPGNGLYRSDDGGATWTRITNDPRIQGNGYMGKVYVDPHDADVVFMMQTSMYKSTDGGKTFVSFKGAPGGDDNHVLWIDPTNSNWMIMGADQGAVVTMDGGTTWTSWYNQATGQIYHLSTDSRFPYWVYGTQQDSGSVGTLSRGDYGAITTLDWDAVGGYEFGYIVPDPLNPNFVYAGGPGRGVVRVDRTNRQIRDVSANVSRDGDYRTAVNPPLVFSSQDPHALYEGTQFVIVTKDGGMTWQKVSPDLTVRADEPAPAPADAAGAPKPPPAPNRTAINTLALSRVSADVMWAGTTNGLVQVTTDAGRSWRDVSPPGLTKYSLISMVEASPFDAATAYVAVDGHETDDFKPHVFRTDDSGRTWQETSAGIPDGSFVRVVREDPVRKGLLYAGTENGAFVSFDAGARWQSLQLNLPTVSVRDLEVHGNDLVAATYGRAFWVLDDVTPHRQIDQGTAGADAVLFKPQTALRIRLNDNGDTPFPPDMPAADNPPNGAVIDYYLKTAAPGEVTIGVYDQHGQLVRQLSSSPEPPVENAPPNVPSYWLATPRPLPTTAGMHRVLWDLRSPPPAALVHDLAIAASYQNTPFSPEGPLASPGRYEIRLTVGGRTYAQPLQIEKDPRVHATQADFDAQLALAQKAVAAMRASFDGHGRADALRTALEDRLKALEGMKKQKAALAAANDLSAKIAAVEGVPTRGFGGFGGGRPAPSFRRINGDLSGLLTSVDQADGPPTDAMTAAYHDYCRDLSTVASQWGALTTKDLPALNARLKKAKLAPIEAPAALDAPACGQ